MGIIDFLRKINGNNGNDEDKDGIWQDMVKRLWDNTQEDFGSVPEEDSDIGGFCAVLEKEIKKHLDNFMPSVPEGEEPEILAVDAHPLFHVSPDHMKAYVCVLPPVNGGDGLEYSRFLEDMRYEGIVYGVSEKTVSQIISTEEYLHIIQIAWGTYPLDGKDGGLEELFERRNEKTLDFYDDSVLAGLDIRKKNKVQTIREGEVICRLYPPMDAHDGVTVSGQVIHAREGKAVRIPQGRNTSVSEDGSVLVADISGIVVTEDGNFAVHDQKIIPNDINADTGDIECDGDLFIRGNIEDGVTINAAGDIIIEGNVKNGKIISGGTIRIQGEVKGSVENELKANRQIQCAIMENAAAAAGGNIYAEVIANSTVVSREGSVYAVSGRGLIFGGNIQACVSVFAKKIGNISECANSFTLGYNPKRADRRDAIENELREIQVLYDRLRKDITAMRANGKNYQRETKAEYTRLVEQRSMYDELARKKTAELEELADMLVSDVSGCISCEKLYPTTQVRIGGYEMTIQKEEANCNIHLRSRQIVLK